MNIIILGTAGFIGTNLAIKLAPNKLDTITLVDTNKDFFTDILKFEFQNVKIIEAPLSASDDLECLLKGQDIVYHLVSTTAPTTSNQYISQEIMDNVIFSANLLEACVKCSVKEIVFISSGGTVYGKDAACPIKEESPTYPISAYGVQKLTTEKLLYLYNYLYGLDYRIIRLANPYGPYQRPNGKLGAVTTFTYKALRNEEIVVFGDGSVIRDYIYIDDAVEALVKIANSNIDHYIYNVGCGFGLSINQVLECIKQTLGTDVKVTYKEARQVDVPVNYLDISRYEEDFGKLNAIKLSKGIALTSDFLKKRYNIC